MSFGSVFGKTSFKTKIVCSALRKSKCNLNVVKLNLPITLVFCLIYWVYSLSFEFFLLEFFSKCRKELPALTSSFCLFTCVTCKSQGLGNSTSAFSRSSHILNPKKDSFQEDWGNITLYKLYFPLSQGGNFKFL